MVKRLRHRPFTAVTRVRFPSESLIYADVAQLAEQLICNQQVIGSSPIIGLVPYTGLKDFGPLAQLVRAPPCHGGDREFESLLGRLYRKIQRFFLFIWDHSSAGRASALQAEGHRFEPCRSHFVTEYCCNHMPAWRNWQTHRT